MASISSSVLKAQLKGLTLRFKDFRRSLDERLTKMNEIREQLTDQANRMATKESVEALEKRINALVWFYVVTLAGLLTTILVKGWLG